MSLVRGQIRHVFLGVESFHGDLSWKAEAEREHDTGKNLVLPLLCLELGRPIFGFVAC